MKSRKNKNSAIYTTPETRKKGQQNANLFAMHIKSIGEVPTMFYIPDEKARESLRPKIEAHGGIIVDTYDAYVYQIKPTRGLRANNINITKQYYVGYVYNSQWIVDSIKKGKLLDEENYLCGFNKKSKLKVLKGNTRKAYTISEVLRIFDLVLEHGGSMKKCPPAKFWSEIAAKNYVPDRSAASLKTAFKKFSVTNRRTFVKAAMK